MAKTTKSPKKYKSIRIDEKVHAKTAALCRKYGLKIDYFTERALMWSAQEWTAKKTLPMLSVEVDREQRG